MPKLNTVVSFGVFVWHNGDRTNIKKITYEIDNQNSEHRRNMGLDCAEWMHEHPDDFIIHSEAIPADKQVAY